MTIPCAGAPALCWNGETSIGCRSGSAAGPRLFQRERGLSATRMAGIMIISMVAVHEDASWRFS
jgi:hypothetical protein